MKQPEEPLGIFLNKALCCICEKPMNMGKTVNMVSLQKKATWAYPTHGNIIVGTQGMALSVVCDHCVEVDEHGNLTALKGEIQNAVELTNDNRIIYHPIKILADV